MKHERKALVGKYENDMFKINYQQIFSIKTKFIGEQRISK